MFDLINIVYVLAILIVIRKYYSISQIYFIIILTHFFSIFLFNNFLFHPSYIPDQFKYLSIAQNIRNFDFFDDYNFVFGETVLISGVFFALFPIPFITTIHSIAIINFLLFLLIFLFMYKNNMLHSKMLTYFYLFYPSLLIYSSVALRDMLIFTILFFTFFFIFIKRNYFAVLLFLIILKYIKFQNLLFLLTSFMFSKIHMIKRDYKVLFLLLVIFTISYIFFGNYFSLESINKYRLAFYEENFNNIHTSLPLLFSYLDLLTNAIPSVLYFFFRPLPWIEKGYLQMIQFIENICIFSIILYIFYKNFKLEIWSYHPIRFLNIFLVTCFIIYGLVLFNSGTAVRYKFPILTVYILFSLYYISIKQQYGKL